MNTKPFISIVTPSYNRGWSIRSCIESLQSQSYTNYEHIIIDGGSKDDTLEILNEAAKGDSRIRFISEPDSGMYDAVNKGMLLAKGDIFTYLNTDDLYFPHTLEIVVNAFESRPEFSMLYGHWMSWHPETKFLEILPVLSYNVNDLISFAVLPQPSVFFKRQVFESIGGFDLTYKLLADNDFFSKAAVNGYKLERIDDYLSIQTVHSGNLLAGNLEARLLAKHEGVRYRQSRKNEHIRKIPSEKSEKLSQIKKYALPISWRTNLVYRWLHKNQISAELRSGVLHNLNYDFSFSLFIKYLFSRADRHKYAYLKVGRECLSDRLGFNIPNIK
jgi:glycosyltransferase involved in cell wall biosynthesis